MDNYISSHDFSPLYSSTDMEFFWSHLKSVILEATLLYIPKLKQSVKQHPKWYTGDIVRKLHCLKSLRKKATSSPTVNNILTLKAAEKSLSFNISLAKSKYESYLVHSFAFSNNKRIYKYIRSYTKQSTLPSTMYFDKLSNSTDLGKATIFNHYFHSVFSNNNNNNNNNNSNKNSAISPNHNSRENDSTLEDIHFTPEDVCSILANLDISKAMGIDGIPNHILKSYSLSLYEPVHHLFHQCYTQSRLPHEWKVHKITPIYKAGDKTSVKNYRPISLLCCISKVFKRIIYNSTFNHISTQISANQFGFLRHRSTTQQLVIFLNTILTAFNCKSQTDVILFRHP